MQYISFHKRKIVSYLMYVLRQNLLTQQDGITQFTDLLCCTCVFLRGFWEKFSTKPLNIQKSLSKTFKVL